MFGCFVESHESTRQRAESVQSKIQDDHIAGKWFTSMSHYNLVHKFIPMPQAMKIPDAKAAVDKEWIKHETIPAWPLDKVKSKEEACPGGTERQKESPLCFIDGLTSPQKCGVISAVQRKSRAPKGHCKRRLWSLCSLY